MKLPLPPRCILRSTMMAAPENLALEEWLLGQTRPGDWRLLLGRNAPGVIIGRYQNAWREASLPALREAGAAIHRRITGGGAVWHDAGNLNFSFITARDSYCVERQFSVVCRALEAIGIRAGRTPHNALVAGDGLKFSGSAFRLTRDGAIHHGTLLVDSDLERLERCLAAPDAGAMSDKSVRSIRARVGNLAALCPGLTVERLSEALIESYREETGEAAAPVIDINAGGLGSEVTALAARHASWEWRMGESPPFTLDGHIGEHGVQLAVEHGIIQQFTFTELQNESHIEIFAALPEHVIGRRFDKDDLESGAEQWQARRKPPALVAQQVWNWMRGLNA